MQGFSNGKRHLAQSLFDLALILAVVRQSEILDFPQDNVPSYQHAGGYEHGPLVGILSGPAHHFQHGPMLRAPVHHQKSVDGFYENIMDEYDSIMRDIRSRTPVVHSPVLNSNIQPESNIMNEGVITMILSLPNEGSSAFGVSGDVQVAPNFNFDGAVGGIMSGLPYSDENFDIFSNYTPSTMLDAEIDNLVLSSSIAGDENSGNSANNHTFLDSRWQQFLTEHNSTYRSVLKGGYNNFGAFDILNEAVQTTELFLPIASNSQDNSGLEDLISTNSDIVTASRVELVEAGEWGSQNHEEDLLFPSLPPPTYEDVLASQQLNSSDTTTVRRQPPNAHMHDHNYFNTTGSNRQTQNTGYAIRSRHEVSTRVISITSRPRHDSDGSTPSVTSEISEPCDLTSEVPMVGVVRSSSRRITTSSDGSVEEIMDGADSSVDFNSFQIRPANYLENFSTDVRLHREVILCN